jgi:hypothetical protein
MSLTPIEVAYQVIQSASTGPDSNSLHDVESDQYPKPCWTNTPLPDSNDFLDLELPSDEAIMEIMVSPDMPWEDLHHRAFFLLDLEWLEDEITNRVATNNVQWSQSPIMIHDVLSEGNLENILKNINIDISLKLVVVEHILIGVDCSPQEIETCTALFK